MTSKNYEPVQIDEYQLHVFGAKSSPTYANFALKRLGIDNEEEYPIAAKTIQNNFYMDDFIKSVETPEEAYGWIFSARTKTGDSPQVCKGTNKEIE